MCDWRTTCPVIPLFPRESRDWTHRADAMVSTEFYYWMIKIVKWQRRDATTSESPVQDTVYYGVLRRSFVRRHHSHKERTNELSMYIPQNIQPPPPRALTTQGAQLSGLYFHLFKFSTSHNFLLPPHVSAQQPSLCRPLSNSPSFSYSARPPHSIHYALLVLSISVCRTTHIFVFGMRESRKYVRSVASVVLKQPDMQIRTHFISSTVHRTTNKRIFGYLLCVCMYMWELISHYDFVLSDRSIAKQPSPSFLTVKHAGLFAYE